MKNSFIYLAKTKVNLTHSLEHVANVCFCDKLLLMEFLLTSGWCPAKVKLWVIPLFSSAKGLDRL